MMNMARSIHGNSTRTESTDIVSVNRNLSNGCIKQILYLMIVEQHYTRYRVPSRKQRYTRHFVTGFITKEKGRRADILRYMKDIGLI